MGHPYLFASAWMILQNNVEPESQFWKNKYVVITFVKISQTGIYT